MSLYWEIEPFRRKMKLNEVLRVGLNPIGLRVLIGARHQESLCTQMEGHVRTWPDKCPFAT